MINDELTAQERTALHASLDRALSESEADCGVAGAKYLRQYFVGREGRFV